MLSLDTLRAQGKEQSFTTVLADLYARASALESSVLAGCKALAATRRVIGSVTERLLETGGAGDRAAMERGARRLALSTGYAAQAVLLAEAAVWAEQSAPQLAAAARDRFERLVALRLCGPLGL